MGELTGWLGVEMSNQILIVARLSCLQSYDEALPRCYMHIEFRTFSICRSTFLMASFIRLIFFFVSSKK